MKSTDNLMAQVVRQHPLILRTGMLACLIWLVYANSRLLPGLLYSGLEQALVQNLRVWAVGLLLLNVALMLVRIWTLYKSTFYDLKFRALIWKNLLDHFFGSVSLKHDPDLTIGTVMDSSTEDIDEIENAASAFIDLVSETLFGLFLILITFWISWQLGMVITASILVIIVMLYATSKWSVALNRAFRSQAASLTSAYSEFLDKNRSYSTGFSRLQTHLHARHTRARVFAALKVEASNGITSLFIQILIFALLFTVVFHPANFAIKAALGLTVVNYILLLSGFSNYVGNFARKQQSRIASEGRLKSIGYNTENAGYTLDVSEAINWLESRAQRQENHVRFLELRETELQEVTQLLCALKNDHFYFAAHENLAYDLCNLNFPEMSIRDFLLMGVDVPVKDVVATLQKVHLGHLEGRFDEPVVLLSGGEKRRVALVRTLLLKATHMVILQPFKYLDQHTAESVLSLLQDHHSQQIYLLSTQ